MSFNINLSTIDSGSLSDNRNDNSFNYWNDPKNEKGKIFNVKDDFTKLEKSRHLNNIYNELVNLTKFHNIDVNNKNLLSIASGSCWLESKWLKSLSPKSLTAIEFSKHRIFELAPKSFDHYGYNYHIDLINGDIMSLDPEINTNKFDIILLCQAFHHIVEPVRLLRNLHKICNSGGKIIIIGEHYYGPASYLMRSAKHFIKYLINHHNYRSNHLFFPAYNELYPPSIMNNDTKGDIHYSKFDYEYLFKEGGRFDTSHHVFKNHKLQAFVLEVIK